MQNVREWNRSIVDGTLIGQIVKSANFRYGLRMMQIFERPAPRLGIVLHYVIARTAGRQFGGTKINKAVVAADTEFQRRYGRTITGAESFQKQKFGPVPNGVRKELGRLRASGKISNVPISTPVGVRDEYFSRVEPDLTAFEAREIDVLNLAISSLERLSANEASALTHDALWEEVEDFSQIPVNAAAFQPVEVDQEILSWALADEF